MSDVARASDSHTRPEARMLNETVCAAGATRHDTAMSSSIVVPARGSLPPPPATCGLAEAEGVALGVGGGTHVKLLPTPATRM